jgi:ankyrin repeat protein
MLAASNRLSTKDKKDVECVKVLLDAKVDIAAVDTTRGWTALHFAAYSNNVEAAELLLKNSNEKGTLCPVVLLIILVVNLPSNRFKQTPLIIATYYKKLEMVKLMLKDGRCDQFIKGILDSVVLWFI